MVLLLGDKNKDNEALGLVIGTVVLLYMPLLNWKFWIAMWLPGYSILGTLSFPHFGTYNVFKCFSCRQSFCNTWENNQTVYQSVDKQFITPGKSAFHYPSQHSSQINIITCIYCKGEDTKNQTALTICDTAVRNKTDGHNYSYPSQEKEVKATFKLFLENLNI